MAYFSKEMKKSIAPKINALLKEYGVKGTIAVQNYSKVVLNIRSGPIDFGGTDIQVNPYYIEGRYPDKAEEFLLKAEKILNTGNYDNSDIQTDYFDVGFYIGINIGSWDKPYVIVTA